MRGIANISTEELNKRKKPLKYILDVEHTFYIKSLNGRRYWSYIADDIAGIKITKCTKPWKYDSPPPPKVQMPEIVEVPDDEK
jgi:hypothetical protein